MDSTFYNFYGIMMVICYVKLCSKSILWCDVMWWHLDMSVDNIPIFTLLGSKPIRFQYLNHLLLLLGHIWIFKKPLRCFIIF